MARGRVNRTLAPLSRISPARCPHSSSPQKPSVLCPLSIRTSDTSQYTKWMQKEVYGGPHVPVSTSPGPANLRLKTVLKINTPFALNRPFPLELQGMCICRRLTLFLYRQSSGDSLEYSRGPSTKPRPHCLRTGRSSPNGTRTHFPW